MHDKEVRIGNCVMDSFYPERDCIVSRINADSRFPIRYKYEDGLKVCTPLGIGRMVGIPLTGDKVMLMFGFKRSDLYSANVYYIGDGEPHERFNIYVDFDADGKFHYATYEYNAGIAEYEYAQKGEPLEYIHEVQNLYFALYRKELSQVK